MLTRLPHLRGQRGSITITFALGFPFFLGFLAFVLTAGDWWVHARHLQTQADSAALAAAQDYFPACTALQTHMESVVADWGGNRNPQVENTQSNVHFVVNKPSYFGQSATDDTPNADPCVSQMVDVKATEDGLVGPISVGFVPKINAHARVQFFKAASLSGALPIAVPEPAPQHVKAYFIDEATGNTIGSSELTANGLDANGNQIWDNSSAPIGLSPAVSQDQIGVRVALGGASSTTCGDPLVNCYPSATSSQLNYVHGYDGASPSSAAAQPKKPIVRGVTLTSTTCDDPYFTTAAPSCAVAVHANIDFGSGSGPGSPDPRAAATASPPGVKAAVRAVVNGTNYTLTWSSGSWDSTESIPVAAGGGAVPITLQWAEQTGTITGLGTCTAPNNNNPFSTGNNGNLCQGSFGVVQRSYAGSDSLTGPIKLVQLWRNGAAGANSLRDCDAANSSCPYQMVVKLTTQASLAVAHSATDPVVTLRTGDQNQTQALNCDPNVPNLKDEIVAGCSPFYAKNTGTACPATTSALWATAQPWTCVGISTGTATNQIASGLNQRILGSASATTCTAPNRYASEFANGWDRSDPRIISLLLVPFGAFGGSGSGTVPVIDFATFYITGWAGQGGGFSNPCAATDDNPGGKGNIVGHFISYTDLGGNPGTSSCDPNALTPCLGVLTR